MKWLMKILGLECEEAGHTVRECQVYVRASEAYNPFNDGIKNHVIVDEVRGDYLQYKYLDIPHATGNVANIRDFLRTYRLVENYVAPVENSTEATESEPQKSTSILDDPEWRPYFDALGSMSKKEQMLNEIIVWLKAKDLWEECKKNLTTRIV